jgi:hypothetical protein
MKKQSQACAAIGRKQITAGCDISLEVELKCELDHPRAGARPDDLPKVGRLPDVYRVSKVYEVEQIEELRSKLEVAFFRQRDELDDRKIHIPLVRTAEDITGRVPLPGNLAEKG